MPFQIVRNDITAMHVDAIVNSANPRVKIGFGVDSAVYKKAGWEKLMAARKQIGEITPGSAVTTPAFGLSARVIIHTNYRANRPLAANWKERIEKDYEKRGREVKE